jgi:hypothetical protein
LRKPNYDFERAQRNNAKEAKARAKAQKKLEQREVQSGTPPDSQDGAPESEFRDDAEGRN